MLTKLKSIGDICKHITDYLKQQSKYKLKIDGQEIVNYPTEGLKQRAGFDFINTETNKKYNISISHIFISFLNYENEENKTFDLDTTDSIKVENVLEQIMKDIGFKK